jgi:hypothetical protein
MTEVAHTLALPIVEPEHQWPAASDRTPVRALLTSLAVVAAAVLSGWTAGWVGVHLIHDEHPKWLLARVSGIAALTLLTGLVMLGLWLAHPRGTLVRRLPRASLLRLHVGLAAFTGAFTVLHVVVLALDDYAGVGWAGVLLPLGSEYRPLPVTLGWLGLYAGLAAGLSARLAGRLGRLWWLLHRSTLVVYAAVWAHGVLAGSDTASLWLWYLASALGVVALAVSRYLTPSLLRNEA